MNIPENLKYTKSHEWVEFLSETRARVGITDFAQAQMGDIVFINLPAEGEHVALGETFTDIESVKAVEDVYSPLTGRIATVNAALEDAPETMNSAPYQAWICEIEEIEGGAEWMDAAAYKTHCETEGA